MTAAFHSVQCDVIGVSVNGYQGCAEAVELLKEVISSKVVGLMQTEDFMRQINELLEGVYQREAARKVVRAEDLERQRVEKIERDRARLQESRKRQREQKRRAKFHGLLSAEADKDILSGEDLCGRSLMSAITVWCWLVSIAEHCRN